MRTRWQIRIFSLLNKQSDWESMISFDHDARLVQPIAGDSTPPCNQKLKLSDLILIIFSVSVITKGTQAQAILHPRHCLLFDMNMNIYQQGIPGKRVDVLDESRPEYNFLVAPMSKKYQNPGESEKRTIQRYSEMLASCHFRTSCTVFALSCLGQRDQFLEKTCISHSE